jgi:predicted DNA-binding transcriptional regulator AlpA|tara:strand:- start:2246 stop:2353 length:108 start_codon:yes stop_codon:yes gene_type:complete
MDQLTSTCNVVRWLNEDYDQWIKRLTKELKKKINK